MTLFLCFLALVALVASPKVSGAGWWAFGVMLAWVASVLGLATLALFSYHGEVPW
jgi:hypothetical protein